MVHGRLGFRVFAQSFIALSLAGAAAFASAEQQAQTTLVVPAAPLLPAKFGPWQAQDAAPPCTDCFHPEGQTAAVFKEDGLTRTSQQSYHLANGPQTMQVEAYQFIDATGAYSAFTYLRGSGAKNYSAARKSGSETIATGTGEFLVLSGTTVVDAHVKQPRPTTSDELRQLAVTLPKIGGIKGLAPQLPTYLPQKGLQDDSVRYALGPVGYQAMGGALPPEILGFDKAAEVITAKYSGKGLLTLLMLPTPQIAGDRGRAIAASLTQQGASAGTVKLRREGPLLLLTTGSWSPSEAEAMVNSIHLRNEVTWNKALPPEFHVEVQKTVSLLSGILIFCGLGALAAIVLGLFFGGGRAAIRVLQGKPAASEPEFLRIDLSGRAEPIHSDPPAAGSQG
ncbi:DUF6599 family protein [Edaphobacter bradus]|uniref:DUF6599 family protein n=1 Tax=Edaphobacter bradus TaxID=2259016 RepID=UPI0021E05145|nr:DUF6599 family protein [Edaphobacter bradus]